ncbi:unnamed protein product [Acanthosepion pharaonis]|uniref:Uncharacterized protein n=1 Tax=Acanthosepion pharaonis TaxID=158019 RepID=A0A812E6M7_ACAPH|nr:unnamed protein product [Sepia pharaonis]
MIVFYVSSDGDALSWDTSSISSEGATVVVAARTGSFLRGCKNIVIRSCFRCFFFCSKSISSGFMTSSTLFQVAELGQLVPNSSQFGRQLLPFLAAFLLRWPTSSSLQGLRRKAVTSNDRSQLQSFLYCGVLDFGRCKSLVVVNNLLPQILPARVNDGRLHFLQCLLDIWEARSNCVLPRVCLHVKIFVFVFLGGIHRSNQARQDIPRV